MKKAFYIYSTTSIRMARAVFTSETNVIKIDYCDEIVVINFD